MHYVFLFGDTVAIEACPLACDYPKDPVSINDFLSISLSEIPGLIHVVR